MLDARSALLNLSENAVSELVIEPTRSNQFRVLRLTITDFPVDRDAVAHELLPLGVLTKIFDEVILKVLVEERDKLEFYKLLLFLFWSLNLRGRAFLLRWLRGGGGRRKAFGRLLRAQKLLRVESWSEGLGGGFRLLRKGVRNRARTLKRRTKRGGKAGFLFFGLSVKLVVFRLGHGKEVLVLLAPFFERLDLFTTEEKRVERAPV